MLVAAHIIHGQSIVTIIMSLITEQAWNVEASPGVITLVGLFAPVPNDSKGMCVDFFVISLSPISFIIDCHSLTHFSI